MTTGEAITSSSAPASPVERRSSSLDPFVFPPDTTFRFILLIVSVIGASLFIFSSLAFMLNIQTQIEQIERCPPPSLEMGFAGISDEQQHARFLAAEQAYAACMAPYELAKAGWQFAGLALLLALAAGLYMLFPAWTIRRSGLVPLTHDEHPELMAELAALCREAGLARPPRFVWDPLAPSSGGLAFGRRKRLYVRLNGGLVRQFYANRPVFRAIMLHELAHIRNADVGKTYFSVAIVISFVLVAVVPYVLYLGQGAFRSGSWFLFFDISARVAALMALVYLSLAAILRTREVYADARAAGWEGPATTLGDLFTGGHPAEQTGRWSSALRFHPPTAERHAVLREPARLLRMGFWEAFGTGMAASIAVQSLSSLMFSIQSGLQVTFPTFLVGALGFAMLAAGITGTGVWRTAFVAHARHTAPRVALRLGIGLGLGIILGRLISFSAFIKDAGAQARALTSFSASILPGLLLLACLVLFLHWIAICATAWLEHAPEGYLPKRGYVITLLVAGLGLAIWSGLLLQNELLLFGNEALELNLGMAMQWFILPHDLILATLIGIWAVPLAAEFARRPRGAIGARDTRSIRNTLLIGVGTAMVFLVVNMAWRVWLRANLSEAERGADEFTLTLYAGTIGRAVVLQVVAATIAAAWSRRHHLLYGLCAAFTAGSLSTAGFAGTLVLSSCVSEFALRTSAVCPQGVELGFAWSTLLYITTAGGLAALPVLLLVGFLVQRIPRAMRVAALGSAIFGLLWCGVGIAAELAGVDPMGWFVALALTTLVIVAIVIVARARRWAFVQAMIGAEVTAVTCVGIVASTSLTIGVASGALEALLTTSALVLAGGLVVVAVVALVETGLLWAIRRKRRRAASSPPMEAASAPRS